MVKYLILKLHYSYILKIFIAVKKKCSAHIACARACLSKEVGRVPHTLNSFVRARSGEPYIGEPYIIVM
jgi:hypothetical protein